MGMRLVALSKQFDRVEVVAATERPESPALGKDAGTVAGIDALGVRIQSELSPATQVVIDFTAPVATRALIPICRRQKVAMVIGTTGLQAAEHALIDEAARDIAILQAPNMSLGVNLLFRIAAEMAEALGDDYDIEIAELHHRFKKDAPSGTAMGIADAILGATGKTRQALIHGREGGECLRQRGEIGMHALRVGDEVGKHTVYFGALGERLELTHTATTRDTFALGALRAAVWLSAQKPGRYTMADVLFGK